jgi:hypothetical protein
MTKIKVLGFDYSDVAEAGPSDDPSVPVQDDEPEPCCGFCWHMGYSSCVRLSGCWNRPQDLPKENKELETTALSILAALGELPEREKSESKEPT